MALTAKQQRFVEEYVVDLNAAAAARRAGYSESGANRAGSRLLSKVDIAAAVVAARAARSGRTEVTQDYVLRRLVIEAERLGEGASHGARVSAVKLLGQHLGMFTDEEVRRELARMRMELDGLKAPARTGTGTGEPGQGTPAAAS